MLWALAICAAAPIGCVQTRSMLYIAELPLLRWIVSVPRSTAARARLTGANFAASLAAGPVQVPPGPIVACPSSACPGPRGRIVC
jgi:hypothetical protein